MFRTINPAAKPLQLNINQDMDMNNTTPTESLLRKGRWSLALFALLGVLAGCGDDGDDPAPGPTTPIVDADPKGYYGSGSLNVRDASGNTLPTITDLRGIVHNNRIMMFSMSAPFYSYDGTFTVSGNSFTGTVQAYTAGHDPVTATINGTINAGTTMSGTFSGTTAGVGSGTFSLNYASSNSGVADISRVSSNLNTSPWRGRAADATTDTYLSAEPNSNDPSALAFSGQFVYSTDGFFSSYFPANGSVRAIPQTNLYVIAGDSTDPGTELLSYTANTAIENNNYNGFATTYTDTTADDRLILTIANGSYHFYGVFAR